MGSSLGGSSKQKGTSDPPAWFDAAAKAALGKIGEIGEIGPLPNMGPSVAAFSQPTMDAFQNINNADAIWNTPGQAPKIAADYIPAPQEFAGGIKGYSSYPLYQESLAKMEAAYPGAMGLLKKMFANQQTGEKSGFWKTAITPTKKELKKIKKAKKKGYYALYPDPTGQYGSGTGTPTTSPTPWKGNFGSSNLGFG